LEAADARSPVEGAGGRVILLRVPESAVVDRVDGQVAVVAPASARTSLAASARQQSRFALRQRARRIASQPSGVPDLGMDGGARSRESKSKVSLVVHGGAAHPAPGRVGLIRALLRKSG